MGANHYLLPTNLFFDFQVPFEEGDIFIDHFFSLPIPNDPALEDAVVLFQFLAVAEGGELAVTNVVGTSVLPDPSIAAQQSSTVAFGGPESSANELQQRIEQSRSVETQKAFSDWIKPLQKVTSGSKTLKDLLKKLKNEMESAGE